MTYTTTPRDAPNAFERRWDRTPGSLTVPIIVYVLFLLAVPTGGVSLLIGLAMAYVLKSEATEAAWTHYVFAIRTVWLGLAYFVIGACLIGVGALLSVILVGIPILAAGIVLALGVKLWFIVRCVVGIARAASGRAYADPRAMMF